MKNPPSFIIPKKSGPQERPEEESMTDIFKKGFNHLLAYPVFLVPPLIPAIVGIFVSLIFIASALATLHSGGGFLLAFITLAAGVTISLVVQLVVSAMLIHMAQRAEEGAKPDLGESFRASMERLGDIVVASMVVSLAVGIGLIFFVIPGLVMAFLLIFTLQEVMVKGKGAVEAVKGSYELVKENFSEALGFFVLLLIVVLIITGILNLVPMVGSFVASLLVTPYYAIVTTIYYLSLSRAGEPRSTILVEG